MNQVLMRSAVTLMQNGKIQQLQRGNRQLEDVKWVYQDKIGYIFPQAATVTVSNQTEQGRWSDITDQKNISEEMVSKEVFMLWLDHGNRPSHASYQYIVVPDVSTHELQETADGNRSIEILSNTPEVQAVRHRTLGLCQIVFYRAGEIEISAGTRIRSDSQGMVMLKLQGERIDKMTVSDPSRKLSRMGITVSNRYDAKGETFVTLPNSEQNNTLILVDLPRDVYAGKSTVVNLGTGKK